MIVAILLERQIGTLTRAGAPTMPRAKTSVILAAQEPAERWSAPGHFGVVYSDSSSAGALSPILSALGIDESGRTLRQRQAKPTKAKAATPTTAKPRGDPNADRAFLDGLKAGLGMTPTE
jgi:hypothetical protein